jgi:phosphatidate cytidylyltransferase
MTASPGKWDDLLTRMASSGAIAAVGLGLMWLGGVWFQALCAVVAGIMVWELARMMRAEDAALPLAAVAGGAVFAAGFLPPSVALPLLLLPALGGLSRLGSHRAVWAAFAFAILLAAFGLVVLREDYGFTWVAWLVCIVIASDVAGYFAGRLIGGPKFWPKVSPKKTWSGTVAGWIAAAAVGLAFMKSTAAGPGIIGVSVAVAMAGQLGDIAESALKRKSGIKDSSNLIPGHGGLFDRFDAMLGASLFLLIVGALIDFPPVPAP